MSYYQGSFEEFMQEVYLWIWIIGGFIIELLWVLLDGIRR